MSGPIEEIALPAINKIILKCHVKLPISNDPLCTSSKIGQKVMLLSSTSAPHAPSRSQDLQTAQRFLATAKTEYSRGGFQSALKEYQSALKIYSRLKSRQQYHVLGRMADCYRRMKNIPAARRLYEESSLVYTGSF